MRSGPQAWFGQAPALQRFERDPPIAPKKLSKFQQFSFSHPRRWPKQGVASDLPIQLLKRNPCGYFARKRPKVLAIFIFAVAASSNPINQNHMQKLRPVHPCDQIHFDVSRF